MTHDELVLEMNDLRAKLEAAMEVAKNRLIKLREMEIKIIQEQHQIEVLEGALEPLLNVWYKQLNAKYKNDDETARNGFVEVQGELLYQVYQALSITPPYGGKLTAIIDTAKSCIGAHFAWGGDSPSGFDCSGFTQYVMKKNGITIPRTVAEQYQYGTSVERDNLKPGDLVFFATYDTNATHVGIYIGKSKFIHATQLPEPGQVSVSLLTEPYYVKRYIGARRLFITHCDRVKRLEDVYQTANEIKIAREHNDHCAELRAIDMVLNALARVDGDSHA